jgi:ankyrin repeat protein
MPPNELALELLLMIAHNIRYASGQLRYGDFNAFLQVNHALYSCLNPTLWQSAAADPSTCARVFARLIRTNNLRGVEVFLSAGANIDIGLPAFGGNYYRRELYLHTPFVVAAIFDNLPLARLLLEHGAALVLYDKEQNPRHSAIHAARSGGMVQLLVDHHADLNQEDATSRFAFSPLHSYAGSNALSAMQVALENGAEVNTIAMRLTPLHFAAYSSLDAVRLLLAYGADIKAKDDRGNTPLHSAVSCGRTDVAMLLSELCPEAVRERNQAGNTPIHTAALSGRVDMVRRFVEVWPEGKKVRNLENETPWQMFESCGGRQWYAETEEEMRALLEIGDLQ